MAGWAVSSLASIFVEKMQPLLLVALPKVIIKFLDLLSFIGEANHLKVE